MICEPWSEPPHPSTGYVVTHRCVHRGEHDEKHPDHACLCGATRPVGWRVFATTRWESDGVTVDPLAPEVEEWSPTEAEALARMYHLGALGYAASCWPMWSDSPVMYGRTP